MKGHGNRRKRSDNDENKVDDFNEADLLLEVGQPTTNGRSQSHKEFFGQKPTGNGMLPLPLTVGPDVEKQFFGQNLTAYGRAQPTSRWSTFSPILT